MCLGGSLMYGRNWRWAKRKKRMTLLCPSAPHGTTNTFPKGRRKLDHAASIHLGASRRLLRRWFSKRGIEFRQPQQPTLKAVAVQFALPRLKFMCEEKDFCLFWVYFTTPRATSRVLRVLALSSLVAGPRDRARVCPTIV